MNNLNYVIIFGYCYLIVRYFSVCGDGKTLTGLRLQLSNKNLITTLGWPLHTKQHNNFDPLSKLFILFSFYIYFCTSSSCLKVKQSTMGTKKREKIWKNRHMTRLRTQLCQFTNLMPIIRWPFYSSLPNKFVKDIPRLLCEMKHPWKKCVMRVLWREQEPIIYMYWIIQNKKSSIIFWTNHVLCKSTLDIYHFCYTFFGPSCRKCTGKVLKYKINGHIWTFFPKIKFPHNEFI